MDARSGVSVLQIKSRLGQYLLEHADRRQPPSMTCGVVADDSAPAHVMLQLVSADSPQRFREMIMQGERLLAPTVQVADADEVIAAAEKEFASLTEGKVRKRENDRKRERPTDSEVLVRAVGRKRGRVASDAGASGGCATASSPGKKSSKRCRALSEPTHYRRASQPA
jgi:hypothetical protein